MISFESVFVPLGVALGLSLLIERLLEVIQNIAEHFVGISEGRAAPAGSQTDKALDEFEKVYRENKFREWMEIKGENLAVERLALKAQLGQEVSSEKRKTLTAHLRALEREIEWDESLSDTTILVEPATDPNGEATIKTFFINLLGFAAGIILARFFDVRLFSALLPSAETIIPHMDYLLTGLVVGGGSGPIHVLIRFISVRKVLGGLQTVTTTESKSSATENKGSGPAIIIPTSELLLTDWEDIPYDGGVDRDRLENVNKRIMNPDMVVYHHTAMSMHTTFEDVVKVIKSRLDSRGNPWITGYHCVITADGGIHPFCRWDRYGNHAAGYNRRSLGIAFNGNFETDSSIPYSNADGRHGPSRPTELQLIAGAKVIALWTFFYPIALHFDCSIIPHHDISSKTCPGSNFPYKKLQHLVMFYREKWDNSTAVKQRIEVLKQKPYLYL